MLSVAGYPFVCLQAGITHLQEGYIYKQAVSQREWVVELPNIRSMSITWHLFRDDCRQRYPICIRDPETSLG